MSLLWTLLAWAAPLAAQTTVQGPLGAGLPVLPAAFTAVNPLAGSPMALSGGALAPALGPAAALPEPSSLPGSPEGPVPEGLDAGESLRARGYVLLPEGIVLPPDVDEALRRALELDPSGSWLGSAPFELRRMLCEDAVWRAPEGWDGVQGALRPFIEEMTLYLRGSLPGEEFELFSAEIRVSRDLERIGDMAHPDGGYLTVTYSLEGPGTVLHPVVDGRVETLAASPRRFAVFSGMDRESAIGVPATAHRAPDTAQGLRIVLLLGYRMAGRPPADSVMDGTALRALGRAEQVQRFLAGEGPGAGASP